MSERIPPGPPPAPLPAGRIAGSRDFEELLFELRDMVETARMMPMSSSVLLNRDEALSLVEDLIEQFPEELRRARWLLKERDEYLTDARREADEVLEAARVQVARMVERTEIAREARRGADHVVAEAEADGRRLRHETEDYIETRLAALEALLARTIQGIRRGRERLQPDLGDPGAEEESEEVGSPIFDQDEA
jgi:F0F1-type ATP synthase membrane subunit b/b'